MCEVSDVFESYESHVLHNNFYCYTVVVDIAMSRTVLHILNLFIYYSYRIV